MYKYKKYLKNKKDLRSWSKDQTVEREREREEGEEKQHFSGDFKGFCRSKFGRPRVKDALRDESYAWVPESQDFTKVQDLVFHENREKAVSREIT